MPFGYSFKIPKITIDHSLTIPNLIPILIPQTTKISCTSVCGTNVDSLFLIIMYRAYSKQ